MTIPYVSASQINKFHTCNRQWFWSRALKDRAPASPAQKNGKEIHDALEHYLRSGDVTLLDMKNPTMRKEVVSLLPGPMLPTVLTEAPISSVPRSKGEDEREPLFQTPPITEYEIGGVLVNGHIDLLVKPAGASVRCPAGVFDFKTGAGSAPSVRAVLDLPQLWIYANAAFQSGIFGQELYLGVIHINTKHWAVKRVGSIVSREWAKEKELWLTQQVEAMKVVWEKNDVNSLEYPEPGVCSMWGGCPYKGRCFSQEGLGLMGGFGG